MRGRAREDGRRPLTLTLSPATGARGPDKSSQSELWRAPGDTWHLESTPVDKRRPKKPVKEDKPAPAALERYADKRDFGITPEPPPGDVVPAGDGPPMFMIHKHDARRLHYDLRLEIEGALASWAVPQGPCFDPD